MDTTVNRPVFAAIARFLLGCWALMALPAAAQISAQPRQGLAEIQQAVREFLAVETAPLPGDIGIAIDEIDQRLKLPACSALQAFLPNGSRLWGRTTVGVRCTAPSAWTVYVAARVHVRADYYVAAGPLPRGHILQASDLVRSRGDLTALPANAVTDPDQAVGRILTMPVRQGMPLRQEGLRNPPAVQQGQAVRIVLSGPGFSVATEGRALAGAVEGQFVQARTANGQLISGTARSGGIIAVAY